MVYYKHLWLNRHVPEARGAVRRFNVAEWIVKELGGEEATEQSQASRNGWLHLRGRRWWPQALEWANAVQAPSVRVHAPAFGRITVDNIGDAVTPAEVWRAALEAVTDQIAELHDAMTIASGPHRTFVVTGGWATSPALVEVKRRRFGPVVPARVEQAGARGAAIFAGLASGATSTAAAFPASV